MRRGEAALEGRVCLAEAGASWVAVELCEVRATAFGLMGGSAETLPAIGLPQRLRLVEGRATAAGRIVGALVEGEVVRARVRIRAATGRSNPGAPDRAQALRRRGVGALAHLVHPALLVRIPERDVWTLVGSLRGLRSRIGERLSLAGPGGALLRALATGDRSQLAANDREAFSRLGIGHLLAVSGLHLALAATLAFALLRRILVRLSWLARRWDVRTGALAGACGVSLAYALLAGWGIPVQRAFVFLLLAGIARFAGRGTSGAHALALAAILVLSAEPSALFEAGAQLSFAATAALLSALQTEPRASLAHGLWARVRRKVELGLRVSATAVAATAPVLAAHGMQVGAFGLIANTVAVPWTAAVLLPVSLTAAAFAARPVLDPLARAVVGLAEWTAQGSLTVVQCIAEYVPDPAPSPVAGWAVGVAALGVLFAVRARTTGRRVVAALAVTSWLQLAPAPVLAPSPPRLWVFDVGMGDAILVEGHGGAVLIDGGWAGAGGSDLGRSTVLPALRALGVRSLAVVVATHGDLDHRGGLERVLETMEVGELWLPHEGGRQPAFAGLRETARARGVPVFERGSGSVPLELGDLRITPLWPPRSLRLASRNDASLVLRVELAGKRVLLTGDIGFSAERGLLAAGADLRADVLMLAHHGSRGSSSPEFLDAVDADVALVSASCGGTRLPTHEALARAREHGMAVWSTGRDGALVAALAGPPDALAVWGWAPQPRCELP